MERDNSLAAKPRCHKKLVWDRQKLAVMSRILEDLFLYPKVTKIKKKVRALLAPLPHLRPCLTHLRRSPKGI